MGGRHLIEAASPCIYSLIREQRLLFACSLMRVSHFVKEFAEDLNPLCTFTDTVAHT